MIAAALCHALAGRIWVELSASKPCWLGCAAGLVIGAFGTELVKELKMAGRDRFLLHVTALALTKGLDWIDLIFYDL